jgi:tetratricopeptide (TPR) repeat protein
MTSPDAFAECRKLYEQRRYADALNACNTLDAGKQTSIEALQVRAACLRILERPSEVVKLLTPDVAARDATLQGELAYALYMNDKFAPAIEWAAKALDADAKLEIAVKAKAGSHRFLDEFDQAKEVLDRAVTVLPQSAVIAGERAAFLLNSTHDTEAALAEARRALALDATNDTALYITIHILIRNGHNAEAQEYVQRALRDAPADDAGLLTVAGRFSLEAGDAKTALEAARKAQRVAPEVWAAYLLEADALLLLDNAPGAIQIAVDASDRFPDSIELAHSAANLLTQDGRFAEAEKCLKQMRALDTPADALWSVEMELLQRQAKWTELRRLLTKIDHEAEKTSLVRVTAAYAHVSIREFEAADRLMTEFLAHARNNDLIYADYIAILIMMNRLEKAKQVAEEVRRRWPNSPSPSISAMSAWLLANDGEYVAAHAAINAERVEAGTREWIHAIRIDVLIMQWRLKEAEDTAREALKQFPLSTRIRLNLAQVHLQRPNEQEKALDVIEEILRRDQSSTTTWQMKVVALRSLGRTREAIDAVEEGLMRYPFSVGLITQRGMLRLYNERDLDCAERDFTEARDHGADGVMPLTGLGSVELRRGRPEEAEAWFHAAREIQESPTTLLNYAWSIVASADPRRLHEAEEICRSILHMNSKNAYAIGCLGAICFQRGDRVRAEHHLAEAVEHGNTDIETLANLGAIRARLGQYEAATAAFTQVLTYDSLHVRSHVELSQLCIKQEKFSEARLASRRAIDAEPASPWGWRAAAAAAFATGDPKRAEGILREALAVVTVSAADSLHLDLARVLISIGDASAEPARYLEAKAQIAHVISRNPSNAHALLLNGFTHLKLNDPAKALRILNNVRETQDIAAYLSAYRDAAHSQVREERLRNMPFFQTMMFLFVIGQAGMVWWYVGEGKIKDAAAGAIIPLLAGILLLSVVLPRLAKFKVVTVEGEMSANVREVRQENLAGPVMRIEAMPSMSTSVTALSYDI